MNNTVHFFAILSLLTTLGMDVKAVSLNDPITVLGAEVVALSKRSPEVILVRHAMTDQFMASVGGCGCDINQLLLRRVMREFGLPVNLSEKEITLFAEHPTNALFTPVEWILFPDGVRAKFLAHRKMNYVIDLLRPLKEGETLREMIKGLGAARVGSVEKGLLNFARWKLKTAEELSLANLYDRLFSQNGMGFDSSVEAREPDLCGATF